MGMITNRKKLDNGQELVDALVKDLNKDPNFIQALYKVSIYSNLMGFLPSFRVEFNKDSTNFDYYVNDEKVSSTRFPVQGSNQ